MCLLHIPKHPWCTCVNPSAVNDAGIPKCPDHVWIIPDSIPPPPATSPNHTPQAHLSALLSQIRRPGPEWRHCPLYHDKHTNPANGHLIHGHELLCPAVHAHQERDPSGHMVLYPWDGLCGACNRPSSVPGGGIPARLVPLIVDPDADLYAGPGEDLESSKIAVGWVTAEGKVVEDSEGLGVQMVKGRSANGGGEGVYVRVNFVGGKSAVYLLPGFYDPTMVGKKKGWLGRAFGGLVGRRAMGNESFEDAGDLV